MNLIFNYLGLYFDGMGGINSHGIKMSFDLEGISNNVRKIYITKIIAYTKEATSQQNKERDTFNKDTEYGKERKSQPKGKRRR